MSNCRNLFSFIFGRIKKDESYTDQIVKFDLNDMYGENSISPDSNHMKGSGSESSEPDSLRFKLFLVAAEWRGKFSLK